LFISDPRIDHYPLVNQEPWPTLAIIAVYLVLVLIGPSFIEKREPLSLKRFLLVYNFALVALSGFMCYEVGPTVVQDFYSCH
jgi:hypothetical protein